MTNRQINQTCSPFLGLLGDYSFGQHVLVQVRFKISGIGVLDVHTQTHT